MGEAIGLEIIHAEHGLIKGTIPVDHRTHQPYGRLHGGATAALVETLGSVGSHLIAAPKEKAAVGVEINVNHLRGKKDGVVTGIAKLIHEGGKLHVWNVDVVDERDRLIASGRLTVMIIPQKNA